MRERERPKEQLAYAAYATMERVARALPERIGHALFGLLGRVAYELMPAVRGTVARNQAQVLGLPVGHAIVRASTREAFGLYARYWFDTFRIRGAPHQDMQSRFVIEGREHMDEALDLGKGVVAVLPHMGNWDAAGHWFSINGYRVVAVAEALRPRRLQDLFLRHREELGIQIIPLTGNGVGHRLASFLKENCIVALVADRDLTGRGVEVEMFGRTRRMPAGPAMLSITSGAPLVACPVFTTERGWLCRVSEPLRRTPSGSTKEDVKALTQMIAREFERAISERPADWHMFQPAWEP